MNSGAKILKYADFANFSESFLKFLSDTEKGVAEKRHTPFIQKSKRLSVNRLEVFLSYSAKRAYPVGGKVLKCCSGSYSVVRISSCGVIDPMAHCAFVLFHSAKF